MNGVIIKIQACMYAIQVSLVYTVYSEASSSTVGQSHYTTISHCFMDWSTDLQQDSNLQTLIRNYVIHVVIIAHKRNNIPSSTRDTVGHIFFSTNQDKGYAAVWREYGLNQMYQLLNLRIR